jgi:hypothetical protein
MDTSKDVVGILRSGEQVPDVDRVFNDDASVRRLIGRLLLRHGRIWRTRKYWTA